MPQAQFEFSNFEDERVEANNYLKESASIPPPLFRCKAQASRHVTVPFGMVWERRLVWFVVFQPPRFLPGLYREHKLELIYMLNIGGFYSLYSL